MRMWRPSRKLSPPSAVIASGTSDARSFTLRAVTVMAPSSPAETGSAPRAAGTAADASSASALAVANITAEAQTVRRNRGFGSGRRAMVTTF